ncbi:MAG: peptide chain release factor N(5)-glutamine methyltransferase [Alphaproteobacteria bacterium]|nr:peptide chain release factor N(5)-glutamine methyltransferase [Alphaproteobacteria bacterium]
MVTLCEHLNAIAHRLVSVGVDTATLDARVLVAHALKLPIESLVSDAHRVLSADEIEAIEMLVKRREQREPVSHIVAARGFWKHDFIVTKDVLTPRPDSETMIEGLLKLRPEKNAPLTILDLGTGSGCLLLSALDEYPNAQGIGVDKSEAALAVARTNAERLKLSSRAVFTKSDWCESLDKNLRADVVLMNPPYIPTRDILVLEKEVREHEPRLALDGGQDGLDDYRKIFSQLSLYLSNHPLILIEVGVNQANDVAEIGHTNGMKLHSILPDIAGIDRIVVLELPDNT